MWKTVGLRGLYLLEVLINKLGITVHLGIAASAGCFFRIVHRFAVQSYGL